MSRGTKSLWVPGVPIPQPRHRATAIGGHARMYLPKKHPVMAWKQSIALLWRNSHGANPKWGDEPLYVCLRFMLPRPASKTRKRTPNVTSPHAVKPDLDNLIKAASDALNGLAWKDDSRIAEMHTSKLIVGDVGTPGLYVHVTPLDFDARDAAHYQAQSEAMMTSED